MFRPGSHASKPVEPNAPRKKWIYMGAPACFELEQACRTVAEAFWSPDQFCSMYVVGSVLKRPDWRDVDIRMMMSDEVFQAEFPDVDITSGAWEHDPKWLLLTTCISKFLSSASGLPVDFQFQPMTHANQHHRGVRNPIGFRYVKKRTP